MLTVRPRYARWFDGAASASHMAEAHGMRFEPGSLGQETRRAGSAYSPLSRCGATWRRNRAAVTLASGRRL